jgi:hypothetical protein
LKAHLGFVWQFSYLRQQRVAQGIAEIIVMSTLMLSRTSFPEPLWQSRWVINNIQHNPVDLAIT